MDGLKKRMKRQNFGGHLPREKKKSDWNNIHGKPTMNLCHRSRTFKNKPWAVGLILTENTYPFPLRRLIILIKV